MAELADMRERAQLLVFMSPQCPHCGRVVGIARGLAGEDTTIDLRVIDAQAEPEIAGSFNVKSVPTTVLDGDRTWIGPVTETELREAIAARKTPAFDIAAFRSLVEAGRMDRAVEKLAGGSAGEAFIELWGTSTTSTRIGLMLAAGEVLEDDQHALDGLVEGLCRHLRSKDGALRGDTADLLGQIGHTDATSGLEGLIDDPNPDVAEIAQEALESIDAAGD